MRLDQELVRRGLCESRTEAQELIDVGTVFLNNIVCTKKTRQVTEKEDIVVTSKRKFVSRGGEKLEGVLLDVFGSEDKVRSFCSAKTALDVGSSTGGFTDCLLSYGVISVDAVDVGTSQLHARVRDDPRVSVFENTDVRAFKSDKKYDIIVADLSFIQLSHVIDDIIKFGAKGTQYFLLIKPQFEVGKGNTKKGIVKDSSLVDDVLDAYINLAKEKGVLGVKIFKCVITGGEGNQEFFLYGGN
ncbi:MAG: TlyA family RNA methyltransferase [Candidatus Paceibacterota bacterium]|jgi:23S rRNA (cytidine1920-2'-O)/16S rRNA (cytidine1409-2'-O)-methyltransferase